MAAAVGMLTSALVSTATADTSRTVDQGVFPVTSLTFGFDSFQGADWSAAELYDAGWDVMGINHVQWRAIEPAPPVGDQHTYHWDLLDPYVSLIAEGHKRMEICVASGSTWGTEVPTGPNPHEQSPPVDMNDWRLFVQALVERYDGDGVDDMPGLTYPVIYMIRIGAEVEAASHWGDFGGTPEKYFELLEHSYAGAKAASPDVLVARAGINFGDYCNDHPDPATLAARIPPAVADYLTGTVTNQQFFDVMDIHPSGKYTAALAFVEYMRDLGLGADKWICSDDTNTSPRNGNRDWSFSPWIYPDDDNDGIEDILAQLGLGIEPGTDNYFTSPGYDAAREIYYPDHAGTVIKRFVFQLMSGVRCSFVQPVADEPSWQEYIWHHAGLLDRRVYEQTSDARQARKPAYWQYRWLATKLIDVKAGAILLEEETPSTFFPLTVVYELTTADDTPLWVMWRDYTIDDTTPVTYTLQSAAPQVRVHHTIDQWGQEEPHSELLDVVAGQIELTLTNLPIVVEPVSSSTPPETPAPPADNTEDGGCGCAAVGARASAAPVPRSKRWYAAVLLLAFIGLGYRRRIRMR